MKRLRLSVLLIILVLSFSVTPARSQQNVTLHLMHWTGLMVKGTDWWDKIVSGFESAHPGVTIENNFVPFAQYLPTLTADAAGGQLPDVFFGHVMAAQLGRAGLGVNYRDVFDDAYFKRFYPGPLRQFTFGKAIYALPWTAQLFNLFVNDKIMGDLGLKAPNTWDELIAMAPKIRAAGYTPLTWGNKAANVCPDFFLPLITQYGGDVYALDDLTDPTVSWNSKPVIDALTLFDKLTKAHVFLDGINGVDEQTGQSIAYQGKAAMMYSGSFLIGGSSGILATAPEDYVKNYSVSKIPAVTADGVHWTGDGSGEGWVVSAKSPNKDLAIELVKYLESDEVQAIHIAGSQDMPPLPSALGQLKDENVKKLTGWLATDGSDHILFGAGSWDAVAGVCAATLDGSITPEAGAAKIQADVMATRAKK